MTDRVDKGQESDELARKGLGEKIESLVNLISKPNDDGGLTVEG